MESKRKPRSENWNLEEKELLRQLIRDSAHIIENKSTKNNFNMEKIKEWKIITNKFNEITGKTRSAEQIKLAWKRMKLTAKANLSAHRQEQLRTGGGKKPPSPSREDLFIADIAPHDFIVENNDFDSDATIVISDTQDIPSTSHHNQEPVNQPTITINEFQSTVTAKKQGISGKSVEGEKINKKTSENTIQHMKEKIVASNIEFKKEQLEMLKVEHQYHIKISQLNIKKLELEIAELEKRKNNDN